MSSPPPSGPAPLEPPPAPKPYPGFAQAVGLMVLALFLGLGASVVVFAVGFLRHGSAAPPVDSWSLSIVNAVAFFGASLAGWLLARRPFLDVFPFRRFPAGLVLPLLVLAPAAVVVLNALTSTLLEWLPVGEDQSWIEEAMRDLLEMLLDNRPAAFTAVVIMAPLTEEVFFRGLLLRGFARRYGPGVAIITTTLLFSLAHLNPVQLPATLLLGAYLAWLTLRTGSLWPAILAHAANNLTALLAGWLFGAERLETWGAGTWPINLLGLVIAVLAALWVISASRKPAPGRDSAISGNSQPPPAV